MPGVVFYMAVRHLAAITRRLVEAGLPPDTPAAVVESGTLPGQRVVVGPLDRIGDLATAAGVHSPAVLAVGEVVGRRVAPSDPAAPAVRRPAGQDLATIDR